MVIFGVVVRLNGVYVFKIMANITVKQKILDALQLFYNKLKQAEIGDLTATGISGNTIADQLSTLNSNKANKNTIIYSTIVYNGAVVASSTNATVDVDFSFPNYFLNSGGVIISKHWPGASWENSHVTIVRDLTIENPSVPKVVLLCGSAQTYQVCLILLHTRSQQ